MNRRKYFPLSIQSHFKKGLGVKELNQEVTKIASLVKNQENLPSVSNPFRFVHRFNQFNMYYNQLNLQQ